MTADAPAQPLNGDALQAGQSEAGFRLLFDLNPYPMWVYEVATLRLLAVNHAAIEAYGYSEEEFLALHLLDLRPESEWPSLRAHLAQPLPSRSRGGIWRHRRRSGEEFDVEIAATAIDFGGRPARLVLAKDITLRVRAEAELRASEQRYRTIVETANEGIWALDANDRTAFVNAKMAAMLGYGVDELLGRPLTDFMDERAAAVARHNLARRRQGVAEQHDFRFRRKDGGELWAMLSASPFADDAGHYAGAIAMVTDVTAAKKAEQQLKLLAASVARFNDIVMITEAEPLDEPGPRIVFVNDAFEARTGYRREEVIGRSPRLLQGPGTDRAELDRIKQQLRLWQPVHARLLNYTKSGQEIWIELDIVPIADDTGWFTHWVAVEQDITERVQAENRDLRREHVLSLIASGAPLGEVLDAIALGVEGVLGGVCCHLMLLAGDGATLRLGAAPSLPEALRLMLDGVPVSADALCCGGAAATARRRVVTDLRARVGDSALGQRLAAAGIAACWSEPVLSHAGAVLGTVCVHLRQVREPTPAEIATVAEFAQVAAIAIERRRAEDALRQSQKMEALGTLAGGIAHDFNNILGAILGNVALAQRELAAPGQATIAGRLDQIHGAALRARHLVQQILAFSRRQAHQAVRQPLGPLVAETAALLRATLPAGVRIELKLADDLPDAEVDGTQLQQVLMNLCTNSWHAMADGKGCIEIGLARADPTARGPGAPADAPGMAHLWVRDDGQGMDERTRARLFEPFFTTKPVGSGTGLGLAVVHGVVSEHRGSVRVESTPGVGTTFHVYLPLGASMALRAPVEPASSPAPAAAPGASASPAAATRRRVLLVDDDEVMLLTAEGLLLSIGYDVATARSGREALARLQSAPAAFDLVVTDLNMPEQSGLDVARAVAVAQPGLPVVICSGYIDAALQAEAEAIGVRALVHKESAVEELGPALQRVF